MTILTFTAIAPAREAALSLGLLLLLLAGAAGYFAFRYFSLKHALRDVCRDLTEIRQELSRNQILHLPLPDRDMERLMELINSSLDDIRQERLSYEKREAEFQQLIENISHDLRTPLTVILGYLKWMRQTSKPESASAGVPQKTSAESAASTDNALKISRDRESLSIIEKNARAMEKLVSQFYTFSRLHAQDYVPNLQDVDVCRILRESLAGNYQILEEAHLALDSCLPERPVIVRGDQEALERIFSNLFQNAARYARSRLEIRLEESGEQSVRIVFQNDTSLLEKSDIPHLFDRFYKSDNSRHQEGSGLGLTVARSLAELMGGSLTAEIPDEPQAAAAGPENSALLIRFVLLLFTASPFTAT